MNNLASNLKKLRKDNNISQEELAESLGVSRQSISKWESASAYPEMEKIIQLCEKFNVNIDDLLNKNIREIKNEETSKNNINKIFESFLGFIKDTVNLFCSMRFKTKIKCLFEQCIVACVLICIIFLIHEIFGDLVSSMLNVFPEKIYYFLLNLFESMYVIFSFIISIGIILYIFKFRYLDYYRKFRNSAIGSDSSNEIKKVDDSFYKNESKIIIRDSKYSEYSFINGIIKLFIFVIKFISFIFLILFCFVLILILTGFVLSFTIIKSGILFLGIILLLFSSAVINILIILILLNFIFNRRCEKKKIIFSFILSIIFLGIGFGICVIGLLNFDIKNSINSDNYSNENITIDMNNKLFIDTYYSYEFVEKEIDNIEISYTINKVCEADIYVLKMDSDMMSLQIHSLCLNPMKIFKQLINDINNKMVTLYNSDIQNIVIYTSKENIEIIKENTIKYYREDY